MSGMVKFFIRVSRIRKFSPLLLPQYSEYLSLDVKNDLDNLKIYITY